MTSSIQEGHGSVSKCFITQYYTVRNQVPVYLYRFYREDSEVLLGDGMPRVVGVDKIKLELQRMNYVDCRTRVLALTDMLDGDRLFIMCSGEMTNDGGKPRRFSESFMLKQSESDPTLFYIKSQMLQMQDELNMSRDDISNGFIMYGEDVHVPAVPLAHTDSDSAVMTDDRDEIKAVAVEEDTAAVQTVNYNGGVLSPSEKGEIGNSHAVSETPLVNEHDSAILEASRTINTSESKEAGGTSKTTTADGSVIDEEEPVPPRPKNWANVVQDMATTVTRMEQHRPATEVVTQHSKPNVVPSRNGVVPPSGPQLNGNVLTKTDTSGSTRRSYNNKEHGSAQRRVNSNKTFNNTSVNRQGTASAGNHGTTGGSARDPFANYPADQQLFIGNLPHSADEKTMYEFFQTYGPVKEIRIFSGGNKSGNKPVPNYGFVLFDSSKTTEQIISSKPLFLPSTRHRINVELKNTRNPPGRRQGAAATAAPAVANLA